MTNYEQITEQTQRLGDQTIQVAVKAGLEDAEQTADAAALCAKLIDLAENEQILILGGGNGALAAALAQRVPAGQIITHDPHLVALRLAERTVALNKLPNVQVGQELSYLPAYQGKLDRVIILAPQSRSLTRRWLVEGQQLLRPNGVLTLVGANTRGVKSLINDLDALFGQALLLGYGKNCRMAEARSATPPPAPEWASAPGIAPGTWLTVEAELAGQTRSLLSLPGVFSAERLDAGTLLLLNHLKIEPGARVLDVGCGYGPIGVAAGLSRAKVADMLDADLLAVAAAQQNLERYGLRGSVMASDGLGAVAGRRYDLIITNPPFHAGKQIELSMAEAFIEQSRRLLTTDGRFVLVANRFLAYDKILAAHFPQVSRIAENRAFHVLAATNTEVAYPIYG